MSQEILNNLETMGVIREKINDNFTELYTGGLGYTDSTDPAINAAVSTSNIDSYDGVVITLTTTGNSQTLQSPTDTTAGKKFTVANKATSTDTITVNTVVLSPEESQGFLWDGADWTINTGIDAQHVDNIPSGSIIATNVQAAINELDSNMYDNIIYVKTAADLNGGVLETGKVYDFQNNTITDSFPLIFPSTGYFIIKNGAYRYTGSETAIVFEATLPHAKIMFNFGIQATHATGKIFDVTASGFGFGAILVMQLCATASFDAVNHGAASLGSISGVLPAFSVNQFLHVEDGLTFSDLPLGANIRDLNVTFWTGATGTLLTFEGTENKMIQISGYTPTIAVGAGDVHQKGIYFDPATDFSDGVSWVNSVPRFLGDATKNDLFQSGSLDQTDVKFEIYNVRGVADSTTTSLIDIDANGLSTDIPDNNAFVMINANTWSDSVSERITVDSNGVGTYTGYNDLTLDITTPHSVEPNTGTNKDIVVRIGNIHAHDNYTVTFTNATNIVNEIDTALSDNDIISFYDTAGILPVELRSDVFYYVVNQLADSFQLAYTSGGTPIVFTDDGTPVNSYSTADFVGFEAKVNTDSGAPINTTAVGLVVVETGDKVCALITSADGTAVNVVGGGAKIRKA